VIRSECSSSHSSRSYAGFFIFPHSKFHAWRDWTFHAVA
jgi:hypothetical protein